MGQQDEKLPRRCSKTKHQVVSFGTGDICRSGGGEDDDNDDIRDGKMSVEVVEVPAVAMFRVARPKLQQQ